MQTIGALNRRFVTKSNIYYTKRYYHHHRNNHRNTSSSYSFEWFKSKFSNSNLKWFAIGPSSTVLFSASYIRYMEPKTRTSFSDKFENDGNILELIYTGYHKWKSQNRTMTNWCVKMGDAFRPSFSFAVYRRKWTDAEALELENNAMFHYDEITDNDFPFHHNRLKKRYEKNQNVLREKRWKGATDEERREMITENRFKKRQERKERDSERKKRGTNPSASEAKQPHVTELTEKLRVRQEKEEALRYEQDRGREGEEKRFKMLMDLMQTEDPMNNLYIFHLKFLQKWSFAGFISNLMIIWDDFGLLNYSTHTQQSVGFIKLLCGLEEGGIIHDGDEMLVVVNEPNHELQIFFKDNFIKHGFDGYARIQNNPHKKAVQQQKWLENYNKKPFQHLVTVKTDLLNECFKSFLLQNSKICKITTPQEVDFYEQTNEELQQIIKKYDL